MWDDLDNERRLMDALHEINKQGYAIHHDESNIIGIAMPIHRDGRLSASLGVYLPANRYTDATREIIFKNLEGATKEIMRKLNRIPQT